MCFCGDPNHWKNECPDKDTAKDKGAFGNREAEDHPRVEVVDLVGDRVGHR